MTSILWDDWESNNGSKIYIKGEGSDAKNYFFEIDIQACIKNDKNIVFEFTLYKEAQSLYVKLRNSFEMDEVIQDIKDRFEIDLSDYRIDLYEYLDLIKGE